MQITDFQNNLHGMLNWFLRPESDHLGMKGQHQVEMVANNIATSYRFFEREVRPFMDTLELKWIDMERFVPEDCHTNYLFPLAQLYDFVFENMGGLVKSFILHGSMTTKDFIRGWSDVDTFVVVNTQTAFDPVRLVQLRKKSFEAHKFLYKIDPLQHHGLIFISEPDLFFYPSIYMPIEALKESKLMFGFNGLPVYERDCGNEMFRSVRGKIRLLKSAQQEKKLRHHDYHGEYLEADFKNYKNAMYQMKYFLGLISLLPSQLMELKGKPCYKRDSFNPSSHYFSPEAWSIVQKASDIRSEWEKKEKHPYKGNEIPEWLREDLGSNYFDQALVFVQELEQLVSSI